MSDAVTASLIGAGSVLAAAWWTNRKLRSIHVLVDGRLTRALDKIAALEDVIGVPEAERDPKGDQL